MTTVIALPVRPHRFLTLGPIRKAEYDDERRLRLANYARSHGDDATADALLSLVEPASQRNGWAPVRPALNGRG